MAKQEFSISKLSAMVATEADAYRLLERLRWGTETDGTTVVPVCPHCGVIGSHYFLTPTNGTSRKTRTGAASQRRVWKCRDCRRQFSVLTGTIFHGTKIPVRTWVLVIFEVCAAKNGVSAREVERKYELTAKTAWFMLHRIREAMKRDPLAGLLSGTVLADETWVGGNPKNRHASDRRERTRLSSTTDKTPVFALVHYETREVRSRAIADVTGATLEPALAEHVNLSKTFLWTDSAKAYQVPARSAVKHETVDHSAGQYVGPGGVSTNLVEGFFSQLKRSVDGTHHHVSVEHLGRYLAQFDFMYSHCKATDSQRMRTLLGRTGGRRLSYKPLRAVRAKAAL